MKELAHSNVDADPIWVSWRWDLEPEEPGKAKWARKCPECEVGVLLVERDQEEHYLKQIDRCILCGQVVFYEDIHEMRWKDGIKPGGQDS